MKRNFFGSLWVTIFSIAVMFLVHNTALSGSGEKSSPSQIGMGRTYVGVARGYEAIGINPANLGISDGRDIQVSIISGGVHFKSDFLNIKTFNRYFSGTTDPVTGEQVPYHLSDNDKKRLLRTFPGGVANTTLDLQGRILGVSYYNERVGGIGLSVLTHAGFQFDLPKDYLRILLEGTHEEGSKYNFSGTRFHTWALSQFALSYGTYPLEVIPFFEWTTFGAGIKFIQGYYYFNTQKYNAIFSSGTLEEGFIFRGEYDIETRYSGLHDIFNGDNKGSVNPLTDPAGNGFGLDLGFTGEIPYGVIIGISLTDIGTIRWSQHTYRMYGQGQFELDDLLDGEQRDSLLVFFDADEEPIAPFRSSLPTTLRLGAAWKVDQSPFFTKIPGTLLVAFDYNQGLIKRFGSSVKPRFSTGLEWRPVEMLPIRTGFSFGGGRLFSWAFGFGVALSVVEIEFATENLGILLFPQSSRLLSAAFGIRLRI